MRHRLPGRGGTDRGKHLVPAMVLLLMATLVTAALQLPQPVAVAAEGPGDPPEQPGGNEPAASSPNVLLITTDDQSVADMAHMPFTRRLIGEQGATFTDAVSSYPLCCPARASILTGQLSHNHGVRTNKGPYGGYPALARQPELNDNTIGTWLQDAGYDTTFVGKYLNGYGNGDTRREIPPGWDGWHGAVRGVYDYYNVTLNENGLPTPHPGEYQTDLFGKRTRQHIATSVAAGRPFFIWESDLAPHTACYPRENRRCKWGPAMPARRDQTRFSNLPLQAARDAAFNERVVSEKPAHIRRLARWNHKRRVGVRRKHRMRVRSLQAVDRSVRKTVEQLRTLDQLDNTLIIFTSDNGYLLGQHRWSGKILPYEASLRVPLLMRGPRIPAGVRVRDSTALVDVAATIADAAGAVPRLTVDGRSLLPLARGQVDAQGYGALSIESGQQGWSGADARWFYQGVRTRRYTYVSYLRTGELELYDRRRDPDELTNVAYRPAYRRTRDALAEKLRRLHDCGGVGCLDVSGQVPRPRAEPYLDSGATVHPDDLGSIGRARQVVMVTARSWSAGTGRATAWQRRGRTWTVRRGPFPVTLGGRGLVRAQDRRAGTGQTPAGTFRPGFALGHLRDPGTALPYRRFDENDYWAMDPRAPRAYNVYQPRHSPRATWRARAAERWRDHRSRYPHAMVMQYNLPRRISHSRRFDQMQAAAPADVRRGSLVLHVGRRISHHGWTSMDRGEMRWLLRWMHPDRMHTRFVLGTPSYLRKRL